VYDAMTEPDKALPLQRPIRQRRKHRKRGSMVRAGRHPVMQRLAIGGRDQQAAFPADPLHFAALQSAHAEPLVRNR
jgi:hypothetical protein